MYHCKLKRKNSSNTLGDKLESFRNSSLMKSLALDQFFKIYIKEFLGYLPVCFENILCFLLLTGPLTRTEKWKGYVSLT